MAEKPNLKPGDWITIGKTDCVVCALYDDPAMGDCEVVYNATKPTNEPARWAGERWEFLHSGAVGGYAANYPRLSTYVGLLRRGRHGG